MMKEFLSRQPTFAGAFIRWGARSASWTRSSQRMKGSTKTLPGDFHHHPWFSRELVKAGRWVTERAFRKWLCGRELRRGKKFGRPPAFTTGENAWWKRGAVATAALATRCGEAIVPRSNSPGESVASTTAVIAKKRFEERKTECNRHEFLWAGIFTGRNIAPKYRQRVNRQLIRSGTALAARHLGVAIGAALRPGRRRKVRIHR